MRNKSEITKVLLDQLPAGHNYTVEKVVPLWWVNIRNTGGLRLTPIGYTVLRTLELESWTVPLPDLKKLNKRILLELDRKLQYPYYIDTKNKSLVLFSSKEAMMATLYGDLEAWLKNIS